MMTPKKAGEKVQQKMKMQMQEERFPGEIWPCKSCGFTLGRLNQEKTHIRMKAKDFFVTIQGGKIHHVCRICGDFNELVDDEYLLWQSERRVLQEFMVNRELYMKFLEKKDAFVKFLSSPKLKEGSKKQPQKSKE